MSTSDASSSFQRPPSPNRAATVNSTEIQAVTQTIHGETIGQAPEGSQPQAVPLSPELYKAAVEGNVTELSKHRGNLKGESKMGNTLLHIAATSSNDLSSSQHPMFIGKVCDLLVTPVDLLTKTNKLRETPLHCATKARSMKTVVKLIELAKNGRPEKLDELLKAKNVYGETALHEAVRVGRVDMVKELIKYHPILMNIVDDQRKVSPLYLASMTNKLDVVRCFTKHKKEDVCCDGPKGQNALHAAVLDNTERQALVKEITRELLKWRSELAVKQDEKDSTPLHFAASVGNLETLKILLEYEQGRNAAYVQDRIGLYPIHVAAQCGRTSVIKILMENFPDSHELVDYRGRNFLHVAIESGTDHDISYFPKRENQMHVLLNSRDLEENTPLHLASKNGDIRSARFLMSCKMSCLSIMNRDGQTPLDLAMKKAEHGFMHRLNTQYNLLRLLMWAEALPSPRRLDQVQDELGLPYFDKKKEIEKAETVTRSLGIISVLVATVTFAATFSMPGGYIADTEPHKGSAVLSKEYLFKAFIVANTVAFVLSMLATSWLVYAGSANVDFKLRMQCLVYSIQMVKIATKSTAAAFCLAVSAVLYQVNFLISMLIFLFTFVVLMFGNPSYDAFLLALPTIWKRKGFRCFKSINPMTRIRVDVGIGHKYSYLFFGSVDVGVKQKFTSMMLSRFFKNVGLFFVIFGLPPLLSKIKINLLSV